MKKIGGSFFLQLIVAFSVIVIVSISVTFYIGVSRSIDTIVENELRLSRTAMKQLAHFTEDSFENVSNIVLQVYNTEQIIGGVKSVNKDKSLYSSPQMVNSVNRYLNTICDSSSDVKELIVMSRNYSTFFGNEKSNMNRSISVRYDFSNDWLIKELRQNSASMMMVYDNPSRYMTTSSSIKTVTFAGNLFEVTTLPQKDTIGYFVMNIPISSFARSYKDFVGDLAGELMLVNSQGQILYSSNESMLGKVYPYYQQALLANGEQVTLDKPCFVDTIRINNADLTVINTLPTDFIWGKMAGINKEMLTILLVSLLVTIAITAIVSNVFRLRIKTIMDYMKKVQQGELNIEIPVKSTDELGQLSLIFNDMCKKLNEYINRTYFAEIREKNSELAALQSQINPHFLYNTLESIKMKAIDENQPEIERMVSTLGKLFRWSVKTKDRIVTVEEEIEYVASYLEIQQFRFGDLLEVKINIDEDILDLGIPKLLLQPIVENAIVHGVSELEGKRFVSIKGQKIGENVKISVTDNGSGISDEQILKLDSEDEDDRYNGIGLRNIHQRIKLIFGEGYGVSICNAKPIGTTVSVIIPATTKKELSQHVRSNDSR